MSVKIDVDFQLDASELTEGIDKHLEAVTATVAGVVGEKAKEIASRKLKSGLKWWEKGFSIDNVGDGVWVLSITGKLAEMMEDGFGPGAISDLILGGNRYKHNKAQGKNYVDVPLPKQVITQNQTIQGTSIRVAQFTDIQEFQKQFTFSDYKKGGVKNKKRLVKRVGDVIQTRKNEKSDASFMTIRRLTPNSKWPEHPFSGAKVFDALDHDIETAFDKALQKLM